MAGRAVLENDRRDVFGGRRFRDVAGIGSQSRDRESHSKGEGAHVVDSIRLNRWRQGVVTFQIGGQTFLAKQYSADCVRTKISLSAMAGVAQHSPSSILFTASKSHSPAALITASLQVWLSVNTLPSAAMGDA